MKLNIQFSVLYSFIIIILIILAGFVFLVIKNEFQLQESNQIQHNSYIIANELRKTSNDLTRYCRTYVTTGDTVWEKRYWEVIDIRNGIKAGPNGRKIALRDSMKKLGFTKEEFEKLKEAEYNSNELVRTEIIAFNALKGKFDDGTGKFTIQKAPDTLLARRIMFDEQYHNNKAKIMKPIDDFIVMLEKRTKKTTKKYENTAYKMLIVTICLLVLIIVLSVFSFFIIKKKIIFQFNRILQREKEQEILNQKLFAKSIEIDQRNIEIKEQHKQIQKSEAKLRESNATKDKFFSIIAHDLRSPFNAILGFSKILLQTHRDYDDDSREELIKSVDSSANRAFKLLENLLTWSLSQSGKINYLPEKLHLKIQVFETIFDLQEVANKKNIKILDTVSENEMIFADKNMITTVLRNLISNAIKFTNKNGEIKISAEQDEKDIIISVIDNGVGINKKELQKIFNISEKASTQGTENEQGTGLGLAVCKEFVEKHSGKIWVESEIDKGSTFYFTIQKNSK
ncbi:MAG: HAMP domain-containing sensor histidine kinase [Bacteroidota bacterium]|nr:HAMP domain-containing sensor histidine kinase [Bacteroidota bacterium]